MKLNDMLQTVARLEDELLEIPEELSLDLKDKVDSYVAVMDHLEADAEQCRKLSEMFRAKALSKENQLKAFKEYTLKSMHTFGWDELKGEARKLKVVKQTRFTVYRDATPSDDPSLVQVTMDYKWNKEALKGKEIDGICGMKDIIYVKKS